MAGILPTSRTGSTYDNAKGHRRGRLFKLFRLYQRRYPILRLCSIGPLFLLAILFLSVYFFAFSSGKSHNPSPPVVPGASSIKDRITRSSHEVSFESGQVVPSDNSTSDADSDKAAQDEAKSQEANQVVQLSDGLSTSDSGDHQGVHGENYEGGEEASEKDSNANDWFEENQNSEPFPKKGAGTEPETETEKGTEKEKDQKIETGTETGTEKDKSEGGKGGELEAEEKKSTEANDAVHLNLPERDEINPKKRDPLAGVQVSSSPGSGKWSSHDTVHRAVAGTVHPGGDHAPLDARWQRARAQVVRAFRHSWQGYKKYAWGKDILRPISGGGEDTLGGLGATIVDSLDTALIMRQGDIVGEAGGWLGEHLGGKIAEGGSVNLFETTIRVLGGLLSAFYLSGGGEGGRAMGWTHSWGPEPQVYLRLASQLGDKLLGAFQDSGTAVPYTDADLKTGRGVNMGLSSTAEVSTVQVEMVALSRETGDPKYESTAMAVLEHISSLPRHHGLVPIYIDSGSGHFHGSNIRLGSRGDSYYEYLAKVYLHQGKDRKVQYLLSLFREALEGFSSQLAGRTRAQKLLFLGELQGGPGGHLTPKMDHLVCFLPGTLALAWSQGLSQENSTLELAEELAHTCFEMYNSTATGLAPEIVYFLTGEGAGEGGTRPDSMYREDLEIHSLDRHNLLRPETVESLFYLFRVTGKEKYREWGLQIFESFEKYTRVESGGYTCLNDVTVVPPPSRDMMETFWLGETLKYFYLLFSEPSLLPLDKVIFNTEAHIFPVFPPKN